MKTIAERAGVSLMTVSLALRNSPRLSLATKTRIQTIADDLGYRPNPLVSALMAQLRHAHPPKSWPTIAFLTPHPDEVYVDENTYIAQIYAGATARARELGYKLERFSLTLPNMTWQRMHSMLYARGVSGIILPPLPNPIPAVDFDWTEFACATIGYSYIHPALHRVANDQFNSIRMAVHRLAGLGYERIGLAIRYEDDERVEGKWTGGFLSFHPYVSEAARIPVFLWHYSGEAPLPKPPPDFEHWLKLHRPDAILALQPKMIQVWLESLGLHPPRDMGIASLNLQRDQMNFSGVDQNNALLGRAAVGLVIEQIHHNERGIPSRATTVMITSDWIDRGTTPPRYPESQKVEGRP